MSTRQAGHLRVGLGVVCHGRYGVAWQGSARRGTARHGRHGLAGRGEACQGPARFGTAGAA